MDDFEKNNVKLIKKKLHLCLTQAGYAKGRSNSYYQFVNDFAIYYKSERPSDLTYMILCFYPLYMPPCSIRIFLFGDRLSFISDYQVKNIANDADEQYINLWCKTIAEFDSNRTMPFIRYLSSPGGVETIYGLDSRADRSLRLIPVPPYHRKRLLLYTYLYSHQYKKAIQLANRTLAEESKQQYPYQPLIENCEQVLMMASKKDDEYVDGIVSEWRAANKERFILSKSRSANGRNVDES